MLTGHPPFKGQNVVDTLQQVLTEEVVAPRRCVPTIPEAVEKICLKCLQKDPGARYGQAGTVAQDLRHALSTEPSPARSPSSARADPAS